MERPLSVVSRSPEETRILGAALAPVLLPGDVLSLTGDLGAGKTTFVQGMASALGVTERVTSPTFTILHEYHGRFPVSHLDVYRLDSYQEVIDLGFEELLDPSSILVIEWGEAVGPLLPRRFLEVELKSGSVEEPNERIVRFRPRGPEWAHKLQTMRATADALLDAASPEVTDHSRFFEAGAPQPRDDSPGGATGIEER